MMTCHRIDDLITDIREEETILRNDMLNPSFWRNQSGETVSLAKGMEKIQMSNIETKVLEAILPDRAGGKKEAGNESGDVIHSVPKHKIKRKTHTKRKRFVFALAAALIVAFGLTAGAAVSNEWDIALVNFMEISNADTMQLEGGTVKIGAGDLSDGIDYRTVAQGKPKKVFLSATTSIGDKNAAYIRFDTNYQVPEGFDETMDYILPENYSIRVYPRNPERSMRETTGASVLTGVVEDGNVSFLLYLHDYEGLNKCYVAVEFENLRVYHDLGMSEEEQKLAKEPELLYTGNWELEWKYSYKSNAKMYHKLRKIEQDGVTYYITKIEVSPMAIRIEAVKHPKDRKTDITEMNIQEIQCKDGRLLTVNGTSSFGCRDGIWLDGSCDMTAIGEALDPENVESIMVAGKEIKLR